MKKRINLLGILIGTLFVGLSAFILWGIFKLETNPNTDYHNFSVNRFSISGAVLFAIVGVFFIFQSYKGKSISAIGKTDVSKFARAKKDDTVGSYMSTKVLPGLGLVVLITAITMLILFLIINSVYTPTN